MLMMTPRADSKSTFATYGSMLPCTEKVTLIQNLEKLGNTGQISAGNNSTTRKIAVVDGMVLVQKFAKKKGTIIGSIVVAFLP